MNIFKSKKGRGKRLVEFIDEDQAWEEESSQGNQGQVVGSVKVSGIPTLFYDLLEDRPKRPFANQKGFLVLRTKNGYIIVKSAPDDDFVEVHNLNDEGKLLAALAKNYGAKVANSVKKFAEEEYSDVLKRARRDGKVYLGRLSPAELNMTGYPSLWDNEASEADGWKFVDVYLVYKHGHYMLEYVYHSNSLDETFIEEEKEADVATDVNELERKDFLKLLNNTLKVIEEQKKNQSTQEQ